MNEISDWTYKKENTVKLEFTEQDCHAGNFLVM